MRHRRGGGTVGTLMAVYVCPSAGEQMRSVTTVRAVAGRGLEGDRYLLGTGHWSGRGSDPVTLVAAETVAELQDAGFPVDAGDLRRNLVVQGVSLEACVGGRLRVGGALLEAVRSCEPCRYLEGLTGVSGLKAALAGRGGVRARVLEGGGIGVGDRVVLLL